MVLKIRRALGTALKEWYNVIQKADVIESKLGTTQKRPSSGISAQEGSWREKKNNDFRVEEKPVYTWRWNIRRATKLKRVVAIPLEPVGDGNGETGKSSEGR